MLTWLLITVDKNKLRSVRTELIISVVKGSCYWHKAEIKEQRSLITSANESSLLSLHSSY